MLKQINALCSKLVVKSMALVVEKQGEMVMTAAIRSSEKVLRHLMDGMRYPLVDGALELVKSHDVAKATDVALEAVALNRELVNQWILAVDRISAE